MVAENTPLKTVDVTGLLSPVSTLRVKISVASVKVGQIVKVGGSDPGSMVQPMAWARGAGHELTEARETGGTHTHLIRRTH